MKSNKMNKLIITPCGFKTWKLVEDFTQVIYNKRITVPKGYKTDLAIVPRFVAGSANLLTAGMKTNGFQIKVFSSSEYVSGTTSFTNIQQLRSCHNEMV